LVSNMRRSIAVMYSPLEPKLPIFLLVIKILHNELESFLLESIFNPV